MNSLSLFLISFRRAFVHSLFDSGLDEAFTPVLRFVGLHEQFVDADHIKAMLGKIGEPSDCIGECFGILVKAGLCHEIMENGYRTHPALRASLARRHPAREEDRRTFVTFMGTLCNEYDGKPLYEQRLVFELFEMNFRNALEMAREPDMRNDICALLSGLGSYAYHAHHFTEAERLYQEYAQAGETFGRLQSQAAAYHQLGIVAQERRDFDAAGGWYRKSLEIKLRQGDEHGAAITYHQLGNVAYQLRDFDAAGGWYRKSLKIELRQGDEYGAAITYHQLGNVAYQLRDFDAAGGWYKKSLEIKLRQGDEYGAASTYHQLGMVAEERRDFDAAEGWYRKSLEISLRQGNEHGAASTYHQLGMVAQERDDLIGAEKRYQTAYELFEKNNDPINAEKALSALRRVQAAQGGGTP